MNELVSIIIPTYNEEKNIEACLKSLLTQRYRPIEIIVVDDGSIDRTEKIVKRLPVKFFKQKHLGPGLARNRGARYAHGEILVFVDADMSFEKDFINDLVKPILRGKTIGTFSKNEMLKNSDNVWSICWNMNRNLPKDRMLLPGYPDKAPVFRAILKKEFDKVSGFEVSGEYTDDWSLSEKLGVRSSLALGAVYYHSNPSTLSEVWRQARWIGKNKFITGSLFRKIRSLILYSLPVSLTVALVKSIVNFNLYFLPFKLFYDLAVFTSVLRSFLSESKAK